MNSKKIYSENVWAARHAMIDLVVMDHFNVADSLGIATMIEEMPAGNISKLFEQLSVLDDNHAKELLEALHAENNSQKSSSLIVNEATWQGQRNQVLLREDNSTNDDHMSTKDLERLIVTGSVASVIPILTVEYFKQGGPERIAGVLKGIKTKNVALYNKIRDALRAKNIKIMPDLKPHADLIRGLLKPEPAKPYLKKWKQDLLGNFSISKFLVRSSVAIIATAGVTYFIMLCFKTFNKFNLEARRACKGTGSERNKCILTYKIKACDTIIKKLEEAIPGCEQKNNPQKCKLSIQKEIWAWSKRKGKYQDDLQKVSQSKIPRAFGK